MLPLKTTFFINRDNRSQQRAIYRVLRTKLGLTNRTAKFFAHEAMENFRSNRSYGFNLPFEIDNSVVAIRFNSVV